MKNEGGYHNYLIPVGVMSAHDNFYLRMKPILSLQLTIQMGNCYPVSMFFLCMNLISTTLLII
ncbi:hypothetical protein MCEMIEM28_00498 [Burkholderiaceae bacterium]